MKKVFLILSLAMLAMANMACAHNGEKKNEKLQSTHVESQSGEVIPMTHAMFIQNVFDYTAEKEWKYKGDKPVIIDFYADWCGPCRKIAPIMKELAKEYEGKVIIYKVDTDKEKELAGAMGIRSLPTIAFIPVKGDPQTIVGAADKNTFTRAIDEFLLGIPAEK